MRGVVVVARRGIGLGTYYSALHVFVPLWRSTVAIHLHDIVEPHSSFFHLPTTSCSVTHQEISRRGGPL